MHYGKQKILHFISSMVFISIIFLACTTSYADQTVISANDPYEKFNRMMFNFNDIIDTSFIKPIATFYNKIIPKPVNKGIHNFFNNLNNLPTIANDLLQLNFYQAANDIWRLVINTTIGIGGLFDIAQRMNLKPYYNDFGLTLAAWGYKNSNYLVLPFFGSSTLREGIGIPIDYYAFSIYPYIHSDSARYGLYALGVVNHRAQTLKYQSVFDEAALDKYIFLRNAYIQRRTYQIEQNAHLRYIRRDVAKFLPQAGQEKAPYP